MYSILSGRAQSARHALALSGLATCRAFAGFFCNDDGPYTV